MNRFFLFCIVSVLSGTLLWGQNDKTSLNFESPELGVGASAGQPKSLGPLNNINLGGTFDSRFLKPNGGKGELDIHVNELFLTATVGDNISILAEQLLLPSEQSSVVGQDHGYVYAVLSNYSFLPQGMSFRVGRFRAKWGYDASSDSPANPIQSGVLKNIGFISDLGFEISGYLGDSFDYSFATLNGPDTLFVTTTDGNGKSITVKNPAENSISSHYYRANYEINSASRIGASYFEGNSYGWRNDAMFDMDTVQPYGKLDRSQLVYKQRISVDGSFRLEKWTFSGEYSFGTDYFSSGNQSVKFYLARADYTFIPNLLSGLFQLDAIDDGFAGSSRPIVGSAELSYHITDTSLLRIFYLTDLKKIRDTYLAGAQMLLTY